ncbi:MAG: hypothetical protein ACYTF9_09130 [Planctomycetota bacterium]|jgi:hypothetical protein
MDDRWAWAEEIWWRHFAPLEAAGCTLQRMGKDAFWERHARDVLPHFPPEAEINLRGLQTPETRARQARIASSRCDAPLQDYCIFEMDGQAAGAFCGYQKTASDYYMLHTTICTDFRRRGLYRRVVDGSIAYTRELGFDTITSDHAPGNNPIIIAKLGAGFRITGLEIMAEVGTTLRLTYYHNPDHLAAYEFRCGLATINERLLQQGEGAMDLLIEQFRTCAPGTAEEGSP